MYQFDSTPFNSPFNSSAFGNAQSQLNAATRQFAETAGKINRLALENAEATFGLQLATFEENVNATFAFWGELAEVRDIDGLKAVLPKGVQVARESIERAVNTGQEVLGRAVKTNEAIAQIAKGQFEAATAKASAEMENAAAEVEKAAKKAVRR